MIGIRDEIELSDIRLYKFHLFFFFSEMYRDFKYANDTSYVYLTGARIKYKRWT